MKTRFNLFNRVVNFLFKPSYALSSVARLFYNKTHIQFVNRNFQMIGDTPRSKSDFLWTRRENMFQSEATQKRPTLTKTIDPKLFKDFYWDKKELVSFCNQNGILSKGGKIELTDRIELFLKTGEIKTPEEATVRQGGWDSEKRITKETPVVNYKNDAKTRSFFEKNIEGFHFNAYLRQFAKAPNSGNLTYGDLIKGWLKEETKKRDSKQKSVISPQFQYNQFQRDFYTSEKGKSREELKEAWNLVRSSPGPATYEHYLTLIEGQLTDEELFKKKERKLEKVSKNKEEIEETKVSVAAVKSQLSTLLPESNEREEGEQVIISTTTRAGIKRKANDSNQNQVFTPSFESLKEKEERERKRAKKELSNNSVSSRGNKKFHITTNQ